MESFTALNVPDIFVFSHTHCAAVQPLPGSRALERTPLVDRRLRPHPWFQDGPTGRVAVRAASAARTGAFGPL
ncbi:hypothetical protein [Streptomyces sp. NRRL F-2747]|uniref:hypothetical protein n=1 Tax=Streptomyces sp. NRRL F-2747 TaxID=1463843 RepID=UPI0004CB4A66|nr:hypothetical protein [Streptomyces sp. NRRL F-2747]